MLIRPVGIIGLPGLLLLAATLFFTMASSGRPDLTNDGANRADTALRVTFFGTSTFLLEDDRDQIFLDAYLSRNSLGIWQPVKPRLKQIRQIIDQHGLCPSRTVQSVPGDPQRCHEGNAPHLSLIIPTHAHYDHALDVGALSLWSGARVIGDQSIQAVIDATAKMDSSLLGLTRWRAAGTGRKARQVQSGDVAGAGDFKARLIRTLHSRNLLSNAMDGTTPSDFRFPASFTGMKEGATWSVHLKHQDRTFLFVPSAGYIGDTFRKMEIRAETVFLGIGGLCLKSRRRIQDHWKDVVSAAGAKTVYLVHWDSSIGIAPGKKPETGQKPRCLNKNLMRLFSDLANGENRPVNLKLPPFHTAFIP